MNKTINVIYGMSLIVLMVTLPSNADSFKQLVGQLKISEMVSELQLKSGDLTYSVQVHAAKVADKIRSNYSAQDLKELRSFLKPLVDIKIQKSGLVQAADRPLNSLDDPTHYDAVWLRDSLWVYLGLSSQIETKPMSKQVLLKMLDYVSSIDQLKRFETVIKKPSIINGQSGPMKVVHIRFDGKSPTFQDVKIKGKPQTWNHKQNDALGLLLDLVMRSVHDGEILPGDLTESHLKALAYFPAYFSAIKFFAMEDAGSWEEIERTNSSSVGLVTSGLERLLAFIKEGDAKNAILIERLKKAASLLKIEGYLGAESLEGLIKKGYERIFKQLEHGGESPLYNPRSKHFRKADAALLNLIYPAELSQLKLSDKEKILEIVKPLIGKVGIKRYLEDSYQSGNFWFKEEQTSDGEALKGANKTADTSSAEDFIARGKQFKEDSEAQWFFDSWYSKIMGLMYKESRNKSYYFEEIKFFNRALGQITGGDEKQGKVLGADGRPVPSMSLPESYNTIIAGKSRFFAPSPITPLNWAKASLIMALDQLNISSSN